MEKNHSIGTLNRALDECLQLKDPLTLLRMTRFILSTSFLGSNITFSEWLPALVGMTRQTSHYILATRKTPLLGIPLALWYLNSVDFKTYANVKVITLL